MTRLSEMLMNEELVEELLDASCPRSEIAYKAAGADCQDHVAYDCFDRAAKHIIPWLAKQQIPKKYDQAYHPCRLL